MKGILKAIYEHEKKGLWYSKLNDLVKKTKYLGPNLSDSSFRTAMKTLRKIRNIIIEKPSDSKRKKLLIHLPPETKEEYPFFFSVPDSYSIEKFKVMSERRQKLTEYFLFGAATGTAYSRTAVGSEMIPGQVISFLNKEGYPLFNEDIAATLNHKKMKELIPIMHDSDTIDGVSITDLVRHRNVGSGGVFKDLVASVDEFKIVAKSLVNMGIIRKRSRDEVSEAIARSGRPKRYEQLRNETRYKLMNSVLQDYIFEVLTLQYFITKRIRASRMAGYKSKAENDWYIYYYGYVPLNNLRTYKKTEEKRILTAGKDGVIEIATPFAIIPAYRPRKKESYIGEIREWNKCIREKLVTLKSVK